ncbi:MAG: hypothetical protein ABS81_09005 [Pseudonocardia sp. SCN 72-86]|nr:MAG: hypothetical protein ABS81_09005 [Pseudonocardia sp. SCN 72-86]
MDAGGHRDGGDHPAVRPGDRGGDAADPDRRLLVVAGDTVAPDVLELAEEQRQRDHGARCVPAQAVGEDRPGVLGRGVRAATPELVARMEDELSAMRRLADDDDIAAWQHAHREFHALITEGAPTLLLRDCPGRPVRTPGCGTGSGTVRTRAVDRSAPPGRTQDRGTRIRPVCRSATANAES